MSWIICYNHNMKIIVKKITALIISSAIFLPMVIYAQNTQGGIVPCSGSDCTFDSLIKLVNNVIDLFLTVAVSLAAITFAIAGGRMLLHPNNPGERGKAKDMFKKTIIGILIVLCAWLVVHTIVSELASNSSSALKFLDKQN